MLSSLSPTLGRRVRKHASHRDSFVESWPSSPIAMIPDPVRVQALPSVQQPCSNPGKSPETPGNASRQKYHYFAGILQSPDTSSNLSCCLHTAEVAGSNPALPTQKVPANYGKREAPGIRSRGSILQPY